MLANENVKMQHYALSIPRWLNFRLTMVGSLMTFLIVGVAMLIAAISPDIAQYSGIIVSYGYSIQLIMNGAIEMITNSEGEMPAIERLLEYSDLEDETKTHMELV